MPTANIHLADVYESVIRRVAIDSVTQLANTMRLPPDTKIMLPGNAETIPMNNGTFGDTNRERINYPTTGRLLVTVMEESNDENVLSQHVGPNEHLPIFQDFDRNVTIYPIYRNVQNVITLDYTAPSLNIAQRWLDELRTRVSQLRAELYQTLEYHYAIPGTILLLLHEVWSKVKDTTEPNLTFKDYLDRHLCRPTTTTDTLTNTHPERSIKERQLEVLGWFDFTSSPPKPEKKDGSGSYTCSVTYSFYYDRPHGFYTRWPLVVHNKPIAKQFHPTEAYSTFRQEDRRVSFLKGNLESFVNSLSNDGIPFIIHPDVDDFVPMEQVQDSKVFFSGLLLINQNDPTRLIDLSKLGEHTFTPYFLEYFFQQRHTLFNDRTSPFTFRLFENQQRVLDCQLRLRDDTLVVETDRPLDMTKMYHFQIGIRVNWRPLLESTRQCLRRYPVVTYTLLKALGITLGNPCYRDIKLLGSKGPRLPSVDCPGQGVLLAAPDKGGRWPWPWLSSEWSGTPWPGYTDRFNGHTWPGGSTVEKDACSPPNWPGVGFDDDPDNPTPPDFVPGQPGDGSGTIPSKDLDDAIEETDLNQGNETNRTAISANLVMYAHIIALNGAR